MSQGFSRRGFLKGSMLSAALGLPAAAVTGSFLSGKAEAGIPEPTEVPAYVTKMFDDNPHLLGYPASAFYRASAEPQPRMLEVRDVGFVPFPGSSIFWDGEMLFNLDKNRVGLIKIFTASFRQGSDGNPPNEYQLNMLIDRWGERSLDKGMLIGGNTARPDLAYSEKYANFLEGSSFFENGTWHCFSTDDMNAWKGVINEIYRPSGASDSVICTGSDYPLDVPKLTSLLDPKSQKAFKKIKPDTIKITRLFVPWYKKGMEDLGTLSLPPQTLPKTVYLFYKNSDTSPEMRLDLKASDVSKLLGFFNYESVDKNAEYPFLKVRKNSHMGVDYNFLDLPVDWKP